MRVSRLIRYAWLLELEPSQLEAVVRMLAGAEIQALKRAIRGRCYEEIKTRG